ncbi:hypothetical protein [Phenylobacterium sp.]|jgi:hypothetical protein|uniref:hypothetical protein n=1 Tax=Phenylobacterium sp. TaxID=1871053 RepID=UPI002F3F0BBB
MGVLYDFPPPPGRAGRPSLAAGLSLEAQAATRLLEAVRRNQPAVAGESLAERELQVFATAVQRLAAVRPLAAGVLAHECACTDEALVLADLAGQAVRDLAPRRKAAAIPVVIHAFCDAVEAGPEDRTPSRPGDRA